MSQIKEIINSFCRIIEAFKLSSLSAEDLRLAKFNNKNVILKMWKFLHELLFFTKNKEPRQINILTMTSEIFAKTPQKIIREIKRDMIKLGYSSKVFTDLPESIENGNSREILIAAGWLISTQNLIDVFIMQTVQSFDEEYFKANIDQEKINAESLREMKNSMKEFEKIDKNEPLAKLNYLKLLNGQLKFKINGLYSCLMEKSHLTFEVHKETRNNQSKINGNLSCQDVHVIKNTKEIEKIESSLEKKNQLLTSLVYWLENENFFWEWMESVIDEKINASENRDESESGEENKNKEALDSFILEDIVNRQIKSTLYAETSLQNKLKLFTEFCKKKKPTDNSNLKGEDFAILENFKDALEFDFKKILNSCNLNEALTSAPSQISCHAQFEPRLTLESKQSNSDNRTKFNIKKANSDKPFKNTLKQEINELENKLFFLKSIYEDEKNDVCEKCVNLVNDLEGCFAVYSK